MENKEDDFDINLTPPGIKHYYGKQNYFCQTADKPSLFQYRDGKTGVWWGTHEDGYALFEFKDKDSDKFWGAFKDEDEWVVFWGKNGRAPQQSQRVDWREAARRAMEKLRKGYEPAFENRLREAFWEAPDWFKNVEVGEQFKAALEARALSLEIKIKKLERTEMKEVLAKRKSFRI